MKLYCDNKIVINIGHYQVQHDKTKHIKVDYLFFEEKLEEGLIGKLDVPTKKQLSNVLAKYLQKQMLKFIQAS